MRPCESFFIKKAKNYDLTMAIGFTLLSMDPKGGTPSTTLGPKMGMEATSLSRILKNIEQKGYILRKRNPKDGRGVLIFLTPLGLEKREESKEVVLRFNEVVKEHVPEEDLNVFFKKIIVFSFLIVHFAYRLPGSPKGVINGQIFHRTGLVFSNI